MGGAFNKWEECLGFFLERSKDFLEEPHQPFCVLIFFFVFFFIPTVVWGVLFSILIHYNEYIMRLGVTAR